MVAQVLIWDVDAQPDCGDDLGAADSHPNLVSFSYFYKFYKAVLLDFIHHNLIVNLLIYFFLII